MRRVLLIAANREQFPEPAFPLGAAYVAGALEAHGIAVRLVDAGLERHPLAAVRREIAAFRPDAVGVSLRNADNAAWPHTRSYVGWYGDLLEGIRAACLSVGGAGRPGGRRAGPAVVLGGPAFAIFPGELLRLLAADAGVTGDGEDGMLRLCRGGDADDTMLSLCRGGIDAAAGAPPGAPGTVVHGELADLSAVGLPARLGDVFPGVERYKTIGVQSARGCTYRCVYCTYPVVEGRRLRRRPPQAVADEIERLYRDHGRGEVFIVDSAFNADEEHMAAVCRALAARRLPVRFSCYLQPRVSDPSLFGLLAAAGCMAVDFGTDAGSESMIAALGKAFTADDVRRASRACRGAGIDFCHSLLFGGPGETRATVEETIRLMDEVAPTAVVAMAGMRIYPGTGLEQAALAAGQIGPDDGLLEPRFYAPDGDLRWLFTQVREAARTRRAWFLPGSRDWSSLWGPRVLRALSDGGPLWRSFPRPRWYKFF